MLFFNGTHFSFSVCVYSESMKLLIGLRTLPSPIIKEFWPYLLYAYRFLTSVKCELTYCLPSVSTCFHIWNPTPSVLFVLFFTLFFVYLLCSCQPYYDYMHAFVHYYFPFCITFWPISSSLFNWCFNFFCTQFNTSIYLQ